MFATRTTKTRSTLPAVLAASCACAVGLVAMPAEAASREHTVVMSNMKFGKLPADARIGDTIVWVNRDTVAHTATDRNKSFDVRTAAGQRARTRISRAGVLHIYCVYHPAMRGTLRVSP